jgi:uncharacterized protein
MGIKRGLYLQQLIDKKDSPKVKIITGLRRSGKSYLLNTLYKNWLLRSGVGDGQIVSIELDDEKNDALLAKSELVRRVESFAPDPAIRYYIFLDEIQLADDFVRAVNSLAKHPNYDV